MKYEFVYTNTAFKDIHKLDEKTKQRIKKTLERYQNDPLHYACKLTNAECGEYRFRVGDYRIVFDLNDDKIIILRVGHRKNIYQNLSH
ncbi:type II toxin-antitoxin system RelE/ParE family toxin [Candidatus Halobeggiatoa sp. HSG11]|nr:type II toxin-antitoxin system RelE/ParE family toxin [Candidatus Halobeggiatoa sp. HSG11]